MILYITYDGLLDPLGSSQIVPYLKSFVRWSKTVHVVSFEKASRIAGPAFRLLSEDLLCCGIHWTPLVFSHGGVIAKLWDLMKMYLTVSLVVFRNDVSVVHGRGHPPSSVGLLMKRLFGTKLIFDLRGLWADERLDKGGWDLRKLSHRFQYSYFKRAERKLLSRADQVVALTDAVVPVLKSLAGVSLENITVIPCCADFNFFKLKDSRSVETARRLAGLGIDHVVLGYLGSAGQMYLLNRYFRLCEIAMSQNPCSFALVVTPDVEAVRELMQTHLKVEFHARVRIRSATRKEVAELLPAMDVLVSFIQPSFARIASSPTKLAECFAVGIPVICNTGVGDVADQISQIDAGMVVEPDSEDSLIHAVTNLSLVLSKGGGRLRDAARGLFDLEIGIERYRSVYACVGLT